ncbi:MAG: tRNA (cytosine(32)/uridine(32)-2'-O)-methyltransferase TrmJ [Endozoicomonas sp. (ex Botrylloides leachii)]|nr:tRNA (cytosine(32)/uridine(32)-2'-O)-methyltransferase TrmJ [Endozoicomonas sp. (ex Botrylloides leachii)]
MSDNIRIILINTFHSGNIGSTARAMKTMGLTDLWLVSPQHFPSPDANSMAAGALDVLEKATLVATLDEAIANCSLVVGTSARRRNMSIPMLTPSDCAEKMVIEAQSSKVALIFGQETMGMTNEELLKCHFHVAIPANPEYPVLNLSAAAQIMSYELFQATVRIKQQGTLMPTTGKELLAECQQMEQFYEHLETALNDIGFIVKAHPGLVMNRLKRLFNRARPEIKELQMLRGILSAAQKKHIH